MKIRESFVANSSSSSFILVETDNGETIYSAGNSEDLDTCTYDTMPIDTLIKKFQDAKERGAKTVTLSSGGGYEG